MWKKVNISDVCEFQSGLWKGKKGHLTDANVIRNTNFKSDGMLSYENIALLQVETKELSKRQLKHGDIILEKSGGGEKTPVGRVCLFKKQDNKIPFSLSNFTCLIRVKEPSILNYKYLHKFLHYMYEAGKTELMQRNSTGIRNLQLKEYKNISIPLPPIAEQQHIVTKLDAAFADINKKIDLSIQKVQKIELLKKKFLNSKLNKINTKDEITINDLCYTSDFVANGSFTSLAKNVKYLDNEDYAILVRLADYRKNFKSKLKYVSKKSYEFLKHSKLEEGDLILTNVGAYSGTPFLIPKLNKPSTLGPNAILVRPDTKKMSNGYLKIFFDSYIGQSLLDSISTGTTHKKFNKTSFRKIKINVPKLNEQVDIVNKFRELNEEVNRFKINMDVTIKNCLSLKNSFFQNLMSKSKT